jgi:hypothetical protein
MLVMDIVPGPGSSNLSGFVNACGTLYFTAVNAAHGLEVWKSDGTAFGTVKVGVPAERRPFTPPEDDPDGNLLEQPVLSWTQPVCSQNQNCSAEGRPAGEDRIRQHASW